jgi:hypothetical protein
MGALDKHGLGPRGAVAADERQVDGEVLPDIGQGGVARG